MDVFCMMCPSTLSETPFPPPLFRFGKVGMHIIRLKCYHFLVIFPKRVKLLFLSTVLAPRIAGRAQARAAGGGHVGLRLAYNKPSRPWVGDGGWFI